MHYLQDHVDRIGDFQLRQQRARLPVMAMELPRRSPDTAVHEEKGNQLGGAEGMWDIALWYIATEQPMMAKEV